MLITIPAPTEAAAIKHWPGEGFDVEAEARVFPGLTVGMSAGYTNTRYRETVTAPKPLSGAAPAIIVQDKQPFPIPPWTFAVNARYDFKLAGMNTYLRADYRYASTYDRNLFDNVCVLPVSEGEAPGKGKP
mgnify:CR=1 FL=1